MGASQRPRAGPGQGADRLAKASEGASDSDLDLAQASADEADDNSAEGAGDDFERRSSTVSPAQHGQRLDKLLVALAPEFSRSHLQSLVERGHVQVDGVVQITASRKLRVGQSLLLALVPTAESQAFRAETMALDIVFEDAHLLVVNKPVGLVVHPAAGHWSGTLLNGLLAHVAGSASLPRAGIVHRLDKDTSGLMVVAKTLPAMTSLVRQISAREVRRIYLALAQGAVAWESQRIDGAIARDPGSRLRMAVLSGGKPARTDVQRLAVATTPEGSFSALRCALHTGRTHQIRVHLAWRGHALVSDALYGGRPALGLQRQALHAAELSFAHPLGGAEMAFQAPPPADLAAAWSQVVAA